MRRVRANSGHRVAAAVVAEVVTAAADTAAAGVTVVVASEEAAATSQSGINHAVIPSGAQRSRGIPPEYASKFDHGIPRLRSE